MAKLSFIIIGAARSGTTSLCSYLSQHKDIFIPSIKELNYFSFKNEKPSFYGPNDYLANKNTVYSLKEYEEILSSEKKCIGECSVSYLYYSNSARSIYEFNPNMKIILILRNPTERAFSSFILLRKQGRETKKTFEEALKAENERINNKWEMMWHYKSVGLYYAQVLNYYNTFPKQNIFIEKFDNFVNNPIDTVNKICSFLDIDIDFNIKTNYSVNSSNKLLINFPKNEKAKDLIKKIIPQNYLYKIKYFLEMKNTINYSLNDKTKKYLTNFFIDDIQKLEKLTEINFRSWYE